MSTWKILAGLFGLLVLLVGTVAMMSAFGSAILLIPLVLALMGLGFVATIYIFAFLSKFWLQQKNPRVQLKHDPNEDSQVRLAVEVEENRAVVIERAGKPIRIIYGGLNLEQLEKLDEDLDPKEAEKLYAGIELKTHDTDTGKALLKYRLRDDIRSPFLGKRFGEFLYRLFRWYESYIYNATGLYAYVPLFTKPKVIPLPRYRVKPRDGNNVYTVVEEGTEGYNTNHVRTTIEPWYFEYKGVDIQGIPFKVTGSVMYSIAENGVRDALYKTSAWNVVLDQAAITVIRSTVRNDATIERILGKVGLDGKAGPTKKKAGDAVEELYDLLGKDVLENMQKFVFKKEGGDMTLQDVGINLHGVLFNDFDPDLTDAELVQLRSPVLQHRVAQGIEMVGKANARNQKRLVDAHKDGGEASEQIIKGDALVRAASSQSGGNTLLDALAGVFIQRNQGGR